MRLSEVLFSGLLRIAHTLAPARRESTANVRCILAISCTALGDTLLSTPAVHSLRLAYPEAKLVLLVHPALRTLFEGHPDADVVLTYSGGWHDFLSVLRMLRHLHVDLACVLHGNEPQATPLAWLAGARRIFKLPNTSSFRFLLTNRDEVVGWNDLGHGADVRLTCARLAGGREVERRMKLTVAPACEAAAQNWLNNHGVPAGATLIALHAGASTTSRRWPLERYAMLAQRRLEHDSKAWIVLTGSAAEADLTRRIMALAPSPRMIDAAGQIPVDVLPALLRRCRAFVSGDTGPMHMAVAVGTPAVALFAVSDYRRSGPSQDLERHIVIQKWRTCNPCLSKRCPYPQPLCMDNISLDEVEAALAHVLGEVEA